MLCKGPLTQACICLLYFEYKFAFLHFYISFSYWFEITPIGLKVDLATIDKWITIFFLVLWLIYCWLKIEVYLSSQMIESGSLDCVIVSTWNAFRRPNPCLSLTLEKEKKKKGVKTSYLSLVKLEGNLFMLSPK